MLEAEPSRPFESVLNDDDETVLRTADRDSDVFAAAEAKRKQDEERTDTYYDLRRRYLALPAEAKALYERVRDTYATQNVAVQ